LVAAEVDRLEERLADALQALNEPRPALGIVHVAHQEVAALLQRDEDEQPELGLQQLRFARLQIGKELLQFQLELAYSTR